MTKHRILIVDDDENVIRALQRLLIEEGYEIFTAQNGFEAIDHLKGSEFSVILSDYRMPELNGIEFLKLASEKSPESVRVLITGLADLDLAIEAINEGHIYKFIEKPWNDKNLKVQIKESMKYYELLREKRELLELIKKQNLELQRYNEQLEENIEEKMLQLRKSNEELQARDEILQFMLDIHPLEESLELILLKIAMLRPYDKIVAYVLEKKLSEMCPKAGFASVDGRPIRMDLDSASFPVIPVKSHMVSESVRDLPDSSIIFSDAARFIPIIKDNSCLGGIYIDNNKSGRAIDLNDITMLTGFLSLAALVIRDYFFTTSLSEVPIELSQILKDLK